MESIIDENHLSVAASDDVRKICEPLFAKSIITMFNCARIYFKRYGWNLVTDGNFQLDFFERRLQLLPFIPKYLMQKRSFHYIPSRSGPYSHVIEYVKINSGIANSFYLFKRYQDHIDIYIFNTSTEYNAFEALNYYINNLDLLERFILKFKYKARLLIRKAAENVFYIPDDMLPKCESDSKNEQLNPIFGNFPAFDDRLANLCLTPKEINIINYLSLGYSASQIAHSLNRSPRTVESHINNIKNKLCCGAKSNIITCIKGLVL